MFRKLLVTSFLIVLAIIMGCTDQEGQTDTMAPRFSLQDINDKTVTLAQYKGSVVILEFWATWCPPCRASVPGLESLHKRYKDKGLVVLAVSVDEGGWDGVRSFMAEQGITYIVLKGTQDVTIKYQIRSIPATLILNKEGRIAKRYLGQSSEEELEKDVRSLL